MLSQQHIKSAAIAASLIVGISAADAAAPVTIDGWRYIQGPNDLHVYVCDHSDCVKGSRVICYFSPANSAVAPGLFRKQESWVSEMLGEPGKTFSPFALGPKWQAWLSSSSSDAKTSEANLGIFESTLKGAKN